MYVAIGVALVNSLHKSVVRRLFVAFMSAFQGHVACRNLPPTGPLTVELLSGESYYLNSLKMTV